METMKGTGDITPTVPRTSDSQALSQQTLCCKNVTLTKKDQQARDKP